MLDGKADARDNVLKNAPHTAEEVTADDWTHPYSREQAAYPLPYLREAKFWPSVARIDNPVRRPQPDLRLPADRGVRRERVVRRGFASSCASSGRFSGPGPTYGAQPRASIPTHSADSGPADRA